MSDAIRLLANALDALNGAANAMYGTEHSLGMVVEGAAIEIEGVLALVGAVEW